MTKQLLNEIFGEDAEIENLEDGNKVTFTRALENFPSYLFVEGKAKSTAETYISDIKQFHKFIKNELSNRIRYVNKIDKIVTDLYKKHLSRKLYDKKYMTATVERKYNSVKVFCQFLEYEYGIKNPTEGDAFGNKGHLQDWNNEYEVKELPKIIKDDELALLLETINNSYDRNVLRDRAIIETLLSTGCRRSELLRLKWEDINFFDREITIRRKKSRNSSVVLVPSTLINSLTELKKSNNNLSVSDYVFKGSTKNSKCLSKSALAEIIKKWVKKANINPEISPHYFRHTFITNCFKEAISIDVILQYTGHKDINSLDAYTHLVSGDTVSVSDMLEEKLFA